VIAAAGAMSQWVHADSDGTLAYETLPTGDRILDFSFAGYGGGGVALPDVPVQRTVMPSGGDDTAAIQAAIDAVSQLPAVGGIRGAVLLAPGTFNFPANATLNIATAGVVLRGSGSGAGGTQLVLTGSPRQFLAIHGSGAWQRTGHAATITDAYVPSGAFSFHVDDAAGFAVGDRVLVERPVTSDWIAFMGMDKLTLNGNPQTWIKAGTRVSSDRIITAVRGNELTVDAPLSDSLDAKYVQPGATVTHYAFAGRITQVGLERLRVVAPALSPMPPITDPNFELLAIDAVEDGWVRDVEFQDFTGGIDIGNTAKRLTLEELHVVHTVPQQSPEPADIAVSGQQILVQRGSSGGTNIHFLVTQATTPGPNVFLAFSATGTKGVDSAPHQRWATGVLFDGVSTPGAGIELQNRGNYGSGHGWSAGFSVLWNCTASHILVQQPPGSQNWSIGSIGKEDVAKPPGGTDVMPQGAVDSPDTPVTPSSLYLAQLCVRLGPQALTNIGY
jgi:hypothetical protein